VNSPRRHMRTLLTGTLLLVAGCAAVEPIFAPPEPAREEGRTPAPVPPPASVPQTVPPEAPAPTEQEGLGRGALGRADVLLDRAIATNDAARKRGEAVDPALVANLRMTKQARDLMGGGQTERAADLLERAIAIDDGSGFGYLYLAYIHLSAGRRDQAEVFLARAQALLPRDPALRIELDQLREQADSAAVPLAGSR